jgi:hypothetical protein
VAQHTDVDNTDCFQLSSLGLTLVAGIQDCKRVANYVTKSKATDTDLQCGDLSS